MKLAKTHEFTEEQESLINRFIEAFSQIENFLHDYLREGSQTPFSDLVREFAKQKRSWNDENTLIMMGDLRNVIIHERFGKKKYLSVPIPSIVETLEGIKEQLTNPELVYPKFRKSVKSFRSDDVLTEVLNVIHRDNYSQFPIYNKDKFIGLLTENGITQWLSQYSEFEDPIIALKDETLRNILELEETRNNYKFISCETTILDAENNFINENLLEAQLITHNGKKSENLIGIITRWDPHYLK